MEPIAGNDCSSWVDDEFRETALVASRLVVFVLVGCTNSNKMGNKELKDGFFSFNEGISLCKCPTVDVARVVFLLYHMNSIPKTTKHTPVGMSNAKISLGDKVNGYFSLIVSKVLSKMSIDIVGNFIILAFKEVISSLLRVAKFVSYHTTKLETFVYWKL